MKTRAFVRGVPLYLFFVGSILIGGQKGINGGPPSIRPKETAPTETSATMNERILKSYGNLPLTFEANEAQADERVKFLARGNRCTLFLTTSEVVLALRKPETETEGKDRALKTRPAQRRLDRRMNNQQSLLRMKILHANPAVQLVGVDELPGKVNYFRGKDAKQWRTGIPTYRQVAYRQVYPGIDLVYYGNQQQLEYDFIVGPGRDPRTIRVGFQGADTLRTDLRGNLILHTSAGEVVQHAPVAYQEINGGRREIASRYALQRNNRVGFRVGPYDASKPLLIDPVLSYSTYLGGNNADNGNGIAVDASGNAYVTGDTASINFPTTPGAWRTTCGGCPAESDAFVTKLDPTGSTLIFSTYLGGTDSDEGLGIAVDGSGSTYVTGDTFSTDFPTTAGAFQTTLTSGTCGNPPDTFPCPDAFVTKLDPTGSSLIYSTYLGGSQAEYGLAIAVDSSGSAYVSGSTASANFPTTGGAFQTTFGGGTCFGSPCPDAFVTKFDPTGSTLVYSTYLGGGDEDDGVGVAVDPQGHAYVTGSTLSTNFPTTSGAFQATFGGGTCGIPPDTSPCPDAFVTKFDPTGSVQIYSTYLGGNNEDGGEGIALDGSGNAYVTGSTSSANFPTTPGAFQTTLGGGTCGIPPDTFPCPDAFVTKLAPTGSMLVYSTYLGGNDNDEGRGIAIDTSGDAHITGLTSSTNFPLMNPVQATFGGGPADAFVTKLLPDGSGLLYSTYIGGTANDEGTGIAIDSSGNVSVTGVTSSINFPLMNPLQATFGGGPADAFVIKLSP